MSVTGLSGSLYTIQRATPFILDAVIALAAGNAPDRQPSVASSVQVKSLAAGSVIVTGTVGGVATTETLTFTADGFRATGQLFTAVTKLTASGTILGTSMEAKALGADGTPQLRLKTNIATGIPGVFSPASPAYNSDKARQTEKTRAMIGFDYFSGFSANKGDFLLDEHTAELWEVIRTNLLRGGQIPHHWEIHVEERSGGSPQ